MVRVLRLWRVRFARVKVRMACQGWLQLCHVYVAVREKKARRDACGLGAEAVRCAMAGVVCVRFWLRRAGRRQGSRAPFMATLSTRLRASASSLSYPARLGLSSPWLFRVACGSGDGAFVRSMDYGTCQQQHVRRWPVHVPHASGLWTLDGTLHAVEHRMPCTHVLVTQGRVREHSRAPAPKRPYSFRVYYSIAISITIRMTVNTRSS